MPSIDSAPYNGDDKLYAKESRAYYRYGWGEIKAGREPEGLDIQQARFAPRRRNATPARLIACWLTR